MSSALEHSLEMLFRQDGAAGLSSKAESASRAVSAVKGKMGPGINHLELNKKAGEAHLAAASSHRQAAEKASDPNSRRDHFRAAAEHERKASEHASAAGSSWDESKHPRDGKGMFS